MYIVQVQAYLWRVLAARLPFKGCDQVQHISSPALSAPHITTNLHLVNSNCFAPEADNRGPVSPLLGF